MASKADETVAWLRGLGYTGSIQDMQLEYLEDQTLETGSSADLQTVEGLAPPVREVLEAP